MNILFILIVNRPENVKGSFIFLPSAFYHLEVDHEIQNIQDFSLASSYLFSFGQSCFYFFLALTTSFILSDFLVSYQRDWNVIVSNISSTTVNVSWLPLNSSSLNSTDIYGYVAVCLRSNSSDILPLSVENASAALNTVVRNLEPYRSYKVKVVALLKDRGAGETTLKSSKETDIRTKEDGT